MTLFIYLKGKKSTNQKHTSRSVNADHILTVLSSCFEAESLLRNNGLIVYSSSQRSVTIAVFLRLTAPDRKCLPLALDTPWRECVLREARDSSEKHRLQRISPGQTWSTDGVCCQEMFIMSVILREIGAHSSSLCVKPFTRVWHASKCVVIKQLTTFIWRRVTVFCLQESKHHGLEYFRETDSSENVCRSVGALLLLSAAVAPVKLVVFNRSAELLRRNTPKTESFSSAELRKALQCAPLVSAGSFAAGLQCVSVQAILTKSLFVLQSRLLTETCKQRRCFSTAEISRR